MPTLVEGTAPAHAGFYVLFVGRVVIMDLLAIVAVLRSI
jgi:hypothetical protein